MTPKVRAVRQRLIIDLEHNVLYAVRVRNLCAERQVIRDLPQSAVVGADAKFFFGAAHAVRFIACNFAQVISMPETEPPSRAKATSMPSRTFGAPHTQS